MENGSSQRESRKVRQSNCLSTGKLTCVLTMFLDGSAVFVRSKNQSDRWSAHKKMFSSINHQGNANKNHPEILFTSTRMAVIKKEKIGNVGEEPGTLLHCWWDDEIVQPLWKTD